MQEGFHDIHPDPLWIAFKKGRTDAFDAIYRNYIQILYNYGRKFTNDSDLVRDCIHNLFLELWNHRQSLSDVYAVKPYLFKGLRRKLMRALSQANAMQDLSHDDAFAISSSYETQHLHDQVEEDRKHHLLGIINKLSKRQREAIFLKYYENLSYEEVAAVMDISINTVYNLLSLAIRKLREQVSKVSFTIIIILCCLMLF